MPANIESIRCGWSSSPSFAPKWVSNSSSVISPVSSFRSSASASGSVRNRFLIVAGSSPSPSQKAAKLSQTGVVRTPPKSKSAATAPDAKPRRRHSYAAGGMAEETTDAPEGIDRAGRRGVVRRERRGRRAAARLRPHLGRALEPDLRRHRRRRGPLGAAPPAARQAARVRARHGARAPRDLGAPGHPGPGPAGRGDVRRRVRQRGAVLRHGVRRRPDPAPGRGRRAVRRGRAARDRRAGGRHAGRDPRRRSRRGRARRARAQGGLRRAPAEALAGPVGEVEDPRARARRQRPRAARRARPRAGPGDHRPRRLPARQHDPRPRRRRGGGRGRLGALHARRPAGRRRPAARLLVRAGRRVHAAVRAGHDRPGLPVARRRRGALRRGARAGTSPRSTTSSRSATGSWRSSSRASTPATRRASTARPTTTSRRSPRSSSAWPRPPTRRSSGYRASAASASRRA